MTTALFFLVVLYFMGAPSWCHTGVPVREGDDVSLNCSGSDATNIWQIFWEIATKDAQVNTVEQCYLIEWRKPCPSETGNTTINHMDVHYSREMQFSNDGSFLSQLTIRNTPAVLRQAVIRCMAGELDNENEEFTEMKSYSLEMYALPETAICNVSITDASEISVSCQIRKVYPKISCHFLIESDMRLNLTRSGFSSQKMSENVDMIYVENKFADFVYYTVVCNTKYTPTQTGSYRFHNEAKMAAGVSLISLKTDWVTVVSQPSNYLKMQMEKGHEGETVGIVNKHENASNKAKISNAYYLLLGTVMILGLTGSAALFLVVWPRCRKWRASGCGTVDRGSAYESIECQVIATLDDNVTQHEINDCDNRMLDSPTCEEFENGQFIGIQDALQQVYNNQIIQALRLEVAARRSNNNRNCEYITPCTPQSTVRASVSDPDLKNSEEDDVSANSFYYDNDDDNDDNNDDDNYDGSDDNVISDANVNDGNIYDNEILGN